MTARRRTTTFVLAAAGAAVAVLVSAETAWALIVQVPVGGRAVPVTRDGVACGPAPQGWAFENERRSIRPPAADAGASRTIEVKVAPSPAGCDGSKDTVTVVAIDRFPEIDVSGVVYWPDEGRLELRGKGLKGAQVVWRRPGAEPLDARDDKNKGSDLCLDPAPAGKAPDPAPAGKAPDPAPAGKAPAPAPAGKAPAPATAGKGPAPAPAGKAPAEQCTVPLQRGLKLDTALFWLPGRASFGPDAIIYDSTGTRADESSFSLRPARVIISQIVPPGVSIDVAAAPGRVPLVHPQAVTSVECSGARCELGEGAVIVRSVPSLTNQVTLRMRLAPRVAFAKGDALETQVSVALPVLQCPMSFASGAPLRETDDTRVVLRLDARCGKEPRLRFFVNGEAAEPVRGPVKAKDESVYVELEVGRLVSDRATVTVTRGDVESTIVGTASTKTAPAPRPRVSLELPKHGKIEILPTNRDAVLKVAALAGDARLVPVAVEGAYGVRAAEGHYLVRGDENAGGFVTLRFAYRVANLPPELSGTNLAIISESTQRAVREASVPAPFATSAAGDAPLAELLCASPDGSPWALAPSRPHELPFEARHTCRIVIHAERISPEHGAQELELEVEVTAADGRRRNEASLSQRLIVLPGSDARIIPIKGGVAEFDQILVRVAVALDESRYALSPTSRQGLPVVQWTAIVEGGLFRLYATAAIPAGLYRMNQPTGQLTLNFGILSRITWLDRRGKESLFGAEVGLMGMGLIQRPGAVEYPPTLGAVAGFGVRVPLGTAGAAVGVHIWGAYEFRDEIVYGSGKNASHLAFIFGPSISIGNVGTNF